MIESGQHERVIIHIDMDAFFVSVEELSNPELKGKPVVVGGRPGGRGVVAAASYAARKFGVRSAMPLREAYRRCPDAIFLDGNPRAYMEWSRKVKATLERFSPLVEMASIDEAYLDLTGTNRLLGPPMQAAHSLHETIASETSLPCSIGIASSRVMAKIGSAMAKPNGVLFVPSGAEAAFLAPFDIARIPGVGKVMQAKLRELGINTIGEAADRGADFLERHFGKSGTALASKARGLDGGAWFSPGFARSDTPKSISHETTFLEDAIDPALIDATLAKLSQLVARRLRERGLWTRTVQVKIRDQDFTTQTHAQTLTEPTQFDAVILDVVRSLYATHRNPNRAIRLLGVHAGALETNPWHQEDLFAPNRTEKWSRALRAVDTLRDRFGESAVGLASALGHGRMERVHENPAGLPGKSDRRGTEAPNRS